MSKHLNIDRVSAEPPIQLRIFNKISEYIDNFFILFAIRLIVEYSSLQLY